MVVNEGEGRGGHICMSSAIYRGLASIVQTEEENLCVLVIKAFGEIRLSRSPIGKRRGVL